MALSGNELVRLVGILPGGGPAAVEEVATTQAVASVGGAATQVAGTTYTFKPSDAGGYKQFTNGSAVTATIDTDANQPMPDGAVLTIEQNGAGVVTIAAVGGVTLVSSGSKVATNGQHAVISAKRTAKDVWTLFGNLN